MTLVTKFYLMAVALLCVCCDRLDMYDQGKVKPLAKSDFFKDGRGARSLPEGVVARGQLKEDDPLYRGRENGKLVENFPFEVTRQDLRRGRERYDIFCSVCHDKTGMGFGMVVRRGFKPSPSFHQERLRKIPVGHLFDVITNGFGAMPGYASQIPARDRWLIIAYLRALQLSQQIPFDQVKDEMNKD